MKDAESISDSCSVGIPHKGEVANKLVNYFLDQTADICPSWKIKEVDANATVGYKVELFPFVFTVHFDDEKMNNPSEALELYENGTKEDIKTTIVSLTSDCDERHVLTVEDIIKNGFLTENEVNTCIEIANKLFDRGRDLAFKKELLLLTSVFKLGKIFNQKDGSASIGLVDEVLTLDSSLYLYTDKKHDTKRSLRGLISTAFPDYNPNENEAHKDETPKIDDTICRKVSKRYRKMYQMLTGEKFKSTPYVGDVNIRIANHVIKYYKRLEKANKKSKRVPKERPVSE